MMGSLYSSRAELILIASGLMCMLPGASVSAILLMVLLLSVWLLKKEPKTERILVLSALVLLLVMPFVLARGASFETRLEEGYEAIWQDLDRQAERAIKAFDIDSLGAREISFDRLSAVAARSETTLFLLDPNGEPLAWAGPGVVHELPAGQRLQRSGFVGAFASITLYSVHAIGEVPPGWRIAAARSLSTQSLPFLDAREVLDWSLADEADWHDESSIRIELEDRPALVVRVGESVDRQRLLLCVSWTVILSLLVLAASRWVRGGSAAWSATAWAALATVFALGAASTTLAVFAGGLVVAAVGFAGWESSKAGRGSPLLRGAIAGGVLAGASFAARFFGDLPDLGGEFLLGDVDVVATRTGFVVLGSGLLLLASRVVGSGSGGKLAIVSVLAAAWLADRPEWALPLVIVASAASTRWLAGQREGGKAKAVLGVLAISALLFGAVDEMSYRLSLRRSMQESLISGVAQPDREELEEVRLAAVRYLMELDLERLAARSTKDLRSEDLAFVLWRESPLARRDALTAMVVEPIVGRGSSFTFGLPMEKGRLAEERARWQGLVPPGWEEMLTKGEVTLQGAGGPSARVWFWILPRPGFSLKAMERGDELDAGLLNGEPTARSRPEGLPDPFLYGLYDLQGHPLLAPWPGAPRLDPVPVGSGEARLPVSSGSVRASWAQGESQIRVIYLPESSLGKAMERLGVHAFGGLLPLIVLGLVAFAGLLGRSDYRQLVATTTRSYSRRLLLVNALLLIVPLAVLNLVFFGAVEQRIEREQRADGEAALASAQRVLGEYLLSLEPGFALETTLNDSLLTWLSRVLQREVSLYWGSREYASSKSELFSVGLLPRRLPGQVYVDLRLSGREISSRRIRAGDTSFVVLYARLDVPGVPTPEQQFVVSVPLLAQEEDVTRELDSLRRTVLLASVTLFVLLGMAGARLASDFTKPILDLVEGTRRIAEGAPSLDLDPSDQELAALVEALDDMAARIALARDRLVSEKNLVDSMVNSINSGVVSLDSDGRVLMANRIAVELLGATPGRRLEESLAERSEVAPVADFLAQAGTEACQATLRLVEPESREWTVVWVPLAGEGDPEALLVVEDVTEVLRVERLEAWAEMARIIAHEIKNPLTPIRLSTELLAEVWARDRERLEEVFDRCTGNILRQVEELRLIASEFSDFSQVMKIHPEEGDLGETIARVLGDYLAAPPPGIELHMRSLETSLMGRFDDRLLSRTIRNLLENAIRASAGGGDVEIEASRGASGLEVTVRDRGPGISPDLLPRIFEPYFTTHESGTGLGLAIAKRIVEEHGGRIEARPRSGGGLEVSFWIPAGT